MTERDRQIEFLMRLLVLADPKAEETLRERLAQAQHDERCLRFAFVLVALVASAAFAGLGYCAVLHPEFFDSTSPTLVKIFCALALGSLICMGVFLACWLWYRHRSNLLYAQCRRLVLDAIHARLESHPLPVFVQTLDFSLPVTTKREPAVAAG